MKVLILGASGMIGSHVFKFFTFKKNYQVYGTYCNKNLNKHFCKVSLKKIYYFDVTVSNLSALIKSVKPNAIINCIGITKKIVKKYSIKEIYKINTNFVFNLKKNCDKNNIKLIHISTDCVFDGKKGNYFENSKPNSRDIYGISKSKSEFFSKKHLVIRTSTIGHEIGTTHGLLEWFLKKKLHCVGFCNAFFSGVTCLKLAQILFLIFKNINKFNGILHIAGPKISKYELLILIRKIYKKKIFILKNASFRIDRSLNNSKMISKIPKTKLGLNWNSMLKNSLKFYKKFKVK